MSAGKKLSKGTGKAKDSESPSPVGTESGDSESPKPAEKPVSLRPLEFEEAVKSLLQVKNPLATTRKTDS